MSLDTLHGSDLIAVPQTEQAMAWLIENGPVIGDPPIEDWILHGLVKAGRIMRLRRSLYLAPGVNGRLIGIAAAVSRIDPGGYISGHAALALRGLTDQDIADWWSISPQRQSDIRYGRTDVHFVCSPDRAAGGERGTVTVAGEPATVGTPSQAILDELRFAPERLDWIATARVLAGAIERRVVTPEALAATFARDRSPSSAVARRLGFILEAVGASVPQAIFDASRATHDITVAPGGDKKIERWRLVAPVSAQEIRRGIQ